MQENIIYGDILFIINFSMDFLNLFLTAKIMHLKERKLPLCLSAVSGGLYSLFSVLFPLGKILSAFICILFSFLMVHIAFGKMKMKSFIKTAFVFYSVNFLMCGSITFLANLLNLWKNGRKVYINGTYDTVYGSIPFGSLILISFICGLISFLSGKIFKKKSNEKTVKIHIELNGKSIDSESLVDSGNLLKDPLTDLPVIFFTFRYIRKIIPPECLPVFYGKMCETDSFPIKIRALPLSSVSGEGLVFGFIPDKIEICGNSVKALIAVDTKTNSYGSFDSLCPRDLVF